MTTPEFTALLLTRSARAYTAATVLALDQTSPELRQSLPRTFPPAEDDIAVRIRQLAEAVSVDAPELFANEITWYRTAFAHRHVTDDYLTGTLAAMQQVFRDELPAESQEIVARHLDRGLAAAAAPPSIPESPIEADGPFIDIARRFLLATLEGRADSGVDLIEDQLARGVDLVDLQDHVIVPVQREVGRMWLLGEIPVADEHLTSRAVDQVLTLIDRRIETPEQAPHVLAFGVSGNHHELGIRLVSQRLKIRGLRVTCLGADLPASDLAGALENRQVDLFAVSATMLLHLSAVASLIRHRNADLGGHPPVLVGGPLFGIAPDLHERLGAEASAADCAGAAAAALKLLGLAG